MPQDGSGSTSAPVSLSTCFWFDGDAMPTAVLPRLLGDPDRKAAGRALQAMLHMGRLDIAAMEAAFRGDG